MEDHIDAYLRQRYIGHTVATQRRMWPWIVLLILIMAGLQTISYMRHSALKTQITAINKTVGNQGQNQQAILRFISDARSTQTLAHRVIRSEARITILENRIKPSPIIQVPPPEKKPEE